MDLENILNNDDYKLLFLKAILLGINYGSSNNVDYYIKNIQNEINKISENNEDNHNIKKIENIITNLENRRNIIISNIQKLNHNNYPFNFHKIAFLKNNLNILNIEIFKKYKELKNKKINNKQNPLQNYVQNHLQNNNLIGELEKTLGNLSNLFI